MTELLTPYGNDLEKAMRGRELNFSAERLSNGYKKNELRLTKAKELFGNSDRTIIVGPGPIKQKDVDLIIELQQKPETTSIVAQ